MGQLRQTTTKSDIKHALIILLAKKDFDLITVSDIAKEAHINRGTFYLHYVDKYDLMQQLVDDIKQNILDKLPVKDTNDQLFQHLVDVFDYVKTEFDLIQLLLKQEANYFIAVIHEFLLEMTERFPQIQARLMCESKLPLDYAKQMFLYSNTAIVVHWINKGGQDTSQQLAHYFLLVNE